MTSRTEALLYAASRAQHTEEKIIPALNKGSIVICERYVLSSLVYQGIGRGIGVEEVKNINLFATGGLVPDITIIFDVENSVKRKLIGGGDRLEIAGEEFHRSVNSGYSTLKNEYPGTFIVDASKSIDEVLKRVIDIIELQLGEK